MNLLFLRDQINKIILFLFIILKFTYKYIQTPELFSSIEFTYKYINLRKQKSN